jgi:hypothetical protein
MNLKKGLLAGAVVFFLVLAVMIVKSDRFQTPKSNDPSVLPPPSVEFDQWRKHWEKQR